MAVYSARQSTYTTGDTVTAAHTNNEFNAILAAFHVSTGHTHDGTTAGDGGPLSTLYSNTISMGTGADTDIAVTFNANSNDGVITWMEDEDYFQFSDDILLSTTEKVQFRDTAIYINSSTDGQLDLVADTEIQIAATTVDINGNVDISGTLSLAGTAITSTAAELNILDGVTSTAAELNILDGVTSTAAELNILDGVTSTAAELNILDGVTATASELNILDGVTSTAAELNILDGVTSTAAELNLLDGSTAGTVVASKAVVVDSNKDLTGMRNLTIAGDLTISGDDLFMGTNTAGHLLIADGTNFNPTAVGDLSEISSVASDDVLLAVDTSGGGLKKITRSTLVAGLATSAGIGNVSEDSTPQLGGDLDVDGNALVSTSNGNIALTPNGTGVVRIDGNVDIQTGEIVLKNGGSVSNIKFYCESSNAHYTQLQSAAHSDYSGNVTLTLPAATDTLVGKATTDTLTNKTLTTPVIAEIDSGGDLTLDATTDIILDADGGDIFFKDGGTTFGSATNTSGNLIIKSGTTTALTFDGANVAVAGDLTVNGTTTTVNSTTVTIDDPIFTLGGDTAPGSDDNKDRGIEFRYHTGTAAKVGFFGYDDSAEVFTFIPDATNSSEVFSGTAGNVAFGNIAGTLTTAAQTNITSVGTLTALTVDNIAIDGATIGHTSDTDLMTLASGGLTVAGTIEGTTITASTALVPDASGGADLGSTSLEWGDVYIADDKKLYLGSDQNFSIEYDEDGNDTTAIVAAGGVSMAPHGSSAGNGTELRFQELAANGANYVGFKAPDAIGSNEVWVLPNADGTANQVLTTDGSNNLSWADGGSESGIASFVADGAITAGKPVILTAAGKAAQVVQTGETVTEGIGSNQEIDTSNLKYIATCKLADTKFLLVYNDVDGSNYPTARIGTVDPDNKTISYGTAVVLASSNEYTYTTCAYDTNASRIGIFCTSTTTYSIKAITGTFSGTTLSMNSFADLGSIDAGGDIFPHALYDPDNNAIVVVVEGAADNNTLTAMEVDVSGSTASVNFSATKTSTNWRAKTNSTDNTLTYDTSTNRFVYIFEDEDDSDNIKGIVLANSGSAFTWGNASSSAGSSSPNAAFAVEYDSTANKTIAFWNENNYTIRYAVGTVTGGTTNSISWGTAATAIGTTDNHRTVLARHHVASGKTLLAASDGTNLKMYVTTTSGTSVSVSDTSYTIGTDELFNYASMTPELSTNNESIVIAGSSASGTDTGKSYVFNAGQTTSTNLTSTNFLGLAAESISDTAAGNITVLGGINSNQTSLAIGTEYWATDTGTIATSGTAFIGRATAATKLKIEPRPIGTTANDAVALDANAKLPAVDGSQLTNVLGPMTMTVKTGADTITAGQPVAYSMGGTDVRCEPVHMITADARYGGMGSSYEIHDWDANSRTYGPNMKFTPNTGDNQNKCLIYDPDTERMIMVYQNNTATEVQYQVGTLNTAGTSMTWGTPGKVLGHANDNSGTDDQLSSNHWDMTYDTHRNKLVFVFNDPYDSSVFSAVVGTVTGGTTNTVAWSQRVDLDTTNRFSDFTSACFDSNVNKTVVAFCDVNDNEYGKYVHVTVSDTGVPSWGNLTTFHSARTEKIAMEHHTASTYNVVYFIDYPNSSYAKIHTAKINSSTGAFETGESESTWYYNSRSYFNLFYHPSSERMVTLDYYSYFIKAKSMSVSTSGTISGSSEFSVSTSGDYDTKRYPLAVVDSDTNKVQVIWRRDQSSNYQTKSRNLIISSDGTISYDSGTEQTYVNYTTAGDHFRAAWHTAGKRLVYVSAGGDGTSTQTGNHWMVSKIRKDNNTHRYIGIAQNTAAAGEECKITTFGQIATNCSDLLSNGLSTSDQNYPRKLWFNGTSTSTNVAFSGTHSLNDSNPYNLAGVALNSSTIIVSFDTTYGVGYDGQSGTYDYIKDQPT